MGLFSLASVLVVHFRNLREESAEVVAWAVVACHCVISGVPSGSLGLDSFQIVRYKRIH